MSKFRLLGSLKARITILCCGLVFLAAFFVSVLNYIKVREITLETAQEKLSGETRLMMLEFEKSYDQLENDAFIISHTPPIAGIIRSLNQQGQDPLDNSTIELWQSRLETIFESIMLEREHYTQIRYVGLRDNGKELVRVNRTADGFERVRGDALQSKADEPYFQDSLTLIEGEVYFSDITLNREHGAIEGALTPTLRTVVPAFDNQKLFGFIIINADYNQLLKRAFNDILPNKETFVVNDLGDYAQYLPEKGVRPFEKHNAYTRQPPPYFDALVQEDVSEGVIYEGGDMAYFIRHVVGENNPGSFLGIILQAPKSEVLAHARQVQNHNLLLAAFLVTFSVLVATVAANRLTRPLWVMTRNILQGSPEQAVPELPTELKDEIGALARAFQVQTKQLLKANEELEEFAYRTSHDLRSPLVSSIGVLRVAGDALKKQDYAKVEKSIHIASTSLSKLEVLVKKLLELSATKHQEEEPQVVNLQEVIKDALDKLSHMEDFEHLNISVSTEVPPFYTLKNRLMVVVENMISNAVKYQDRNERSSALHIGALQKDDQVELIFEDNGLGIPESKRNELFAMFKRFHPKTSYGSGLGLYMVKKSVDILEGDIWFEAPEKGARFVVNIPFKQSEESECR